MLEIVSVKPHLPSHSDFVMLECFTVSMTVKYPYSLNELRPQVWTNAINKRNPAGKWHAIDMTLLQTEADEQTHHFFCTCVLTGQGTFEFTTRVGFISNPTNSKEDPDDDEEVEFWKWAGGFGNNGRIVVHPPNNKMPWTNGPKAVQVAPNVYIGNYIAASHAHELGFNAVLNMSVELDDYYAEAANIKYKKIPIPDGAHNTIPEPAIREAIQFIEESVSKGCKVLVHCRAGIGRSGSIGIAYLYYVNASWSFKETLKAIWKMKPDIYPHKDLDTILERLYPRNEEAVSDPDLPTSVPDGLVV